MKTVFSYIKDYQQSVNRYIFLPAVLLMAVGVFLNYYCRLPFMIQQWSRFAQYIVWFSVFLPAFSFAYIMQAIIKKTGWFSDKKFVVLLLLAPALFAWKMVFTIHLPITKDRLMNSYWNHILYWPFALIVISAALFFIWKLYNDVPTFYGITTKNFKAGPYWLMLLMMLPLIAAAATQPDFLAVYPKLKSISFLHQQHTFFFKLLYELAYGTDFFTIELFFRGFLILAFAQWAGKDAILPMALFYCTIHFSKPLGECISSFFGGLILGIITYNTRTIFGGLIVHLGIAWLMELAGYLG